MTYTNLFNFTNKTVLITGGGGSIGSEIAKAFVECGANVAVSDIDIKKAEHVSKTLSDMGIIVPFEVDVTKVASIEKLVDDVVSRFKRIDILVNHAGLNIRKPAVEFTEKDWDTVINTNLKGIFFMAQKVGKVMIKQKKGKIINTASVSAVRGHPNLAIYAASKGGVQQLTKVLANEWAKFNINVNAIGPGYTMTGQTMKFLSNQKTFKSILDKIPMGRLGTPEDMAKAVLFLASEASDYITGHTLFVEGGRLID
ncbi:MAG: 2-dehydro-3-deoxy-D-gluconate 5-dehydrogenase [Thermosediminibacterales bacterium]|nr:2-dehydro-3-deoxy-D-gluconate 5-dehydrogenase [Thermosediminibacterales bacterium]MDK2835305.1 2-dehydro-3-deoxy-D-gluconate 5-dehydrogenase [Thermosediminibacterales bacterium]